MKKNIIVITGAPGSGKTTLINALQEKGFICFEEVSRSITLEAQKNGIDQLFLEQPLLFSDMLMEGRFNQLVEAKTSNAEFIFLDRGIPDILAYMDYINQFYPESYINNCNENRYDKVFLLPPWQEIYVSDQARYETFKEAEKIHLFLLETYQKYNYEVKIVPTGTIDERISYIFNNM